MSIYTKTGDRGETSLASGQRVAKTDRRIEAYGTVDELNSHIGLLRAQIVCADGVAETAQTEDVVSKLAWVQNKLFNLGAALSEAPGEWIAETDVQQLEQCIDALQNELPALRAFVLPAGNMAACQCHVCRTVCRRAERRMIEAQTNERSLRFINRLSDYLFVLARALNVRSKMAEECWKKA
jgi:cob(I)alamin adenosyltransferase